MPGARGKRKSRVQLGCTRNAYGATPDGVGCAAPLHTERLGGKADCGCDGSGLVGRVCSFAAHATAWREGRLRVGGRRARLTVQRRGLCCGAIEPGPGHCRVPAGGLEGGASHRVPRPCVRCAAKLHTLLGYHCINHAGETAGWGRHLLRRSSRVQLGCTRNAYGATPDGVGCAAPLHTEGTECRRHPDVPCSIPCHASHVQGRVCSSAAHGTHG